MCYGGYVNGGLEKWQAQALAPALAQWDAHLERVAAVAAGAPAGSGSSDEAVFLAGGAAPTVADFKGYEELDKCRLLVSGCLDRHPRLAAYVARVEALPALQAYFASDRYMARPVNNPHAQFK